jgi:hypothetical protein
MPDNSGKTLPSVVRVEEKCEDCGGSGHDTGSLSPIELEHCPVCQGSGAQVVVHNYLAEALRITAGRSSIFAQREHFEAGFSTAAVWLAR